MPCKTEFYDTYQDQKHREQAKILNYAYGKLNKKEIKEEERLQKYNYQIEQKERKLLAELKEKYGE